MSYASLDQEWDQTSEEMKNERPELYDAVLCWYPEVCAGTVQDIVKRDGEVFYLVLLEDGNVDEYSAEDVLKRKTEAAA